MPAKRTYGSLTGGTGDVNPQTYVLSMPSNVVSTLIDPGPAQHAVRGFPLPVPKFSASLNKSVVVELLGVQWEMDSPTVPNISGVINSVMYSVSSAAYPTGSGGTWASFVGNSSALSLFRKSIGFVSFPGSGTTNETPPVLSSFEGGGAQIYDFNLSEYDDLTDEAGHGLLVATDNIYLNVWLDSTGAQVINNPAVVAILHYRLKEIGLQEYIGLVQSQQQAPAFLAQ